MPDRKSESFEVYVGGVQLAESALSEAFCYMKDAVLAAQLAGDSVPPQEITELLLMREKIKELRDVCMAFSDDAKSLFDNYKQTLANAEEYRAYCEARKEKDNA